jgi:hypothetical protein
MQPRIALQQQPGGADEGAAVTSGVIGISSASGCPT